MKGMLYGIGVGPGDPELLTLKAVSTMEKCHIIAIPKGGGDGSTAYGIAKKYIKEKPLLECRFSMEKDEGRRMVLREKCAEDICALLDEGKDVGFITLGDPTIYSTYIYIHNIVMAKGYETKIIPGVPSFTAAAAAANIPLCEGNEFLHIIPGTRGDCIKQLSALPGSKVVMKSGDSLPKILTAIEKNGLSEKTKIVERCGMNGERIFDNICEMTDEVTDTGHGGYFSVVIIKDTQTIDKNTKMMI